MNKVIDIYLFKFATTGIIHEWKNPETGMNLSEVSH